MQAELALASGYRQAQGLDRRTSVYNMGKQHQGTSAIAVTCAGDAYEHAALFSLKTRDEASMERSFAQLKSFYADTK